MTKTITQIDEEIAKLQKEKGLLNSTIKTNLKVKEWNLEITPIQDWNKPYNQIIIPKGFRKIKVWELWRLLESKYADEFLGDYKGEYNRFWCEQTNYDKEDKENGYSRWLYFDWSLDLGSGNDVLADSNVNGRVIFCKDIGDKYDE